MKLLTYLCCFLIAVLPACGVLTAEQKASVRQTVQSEYEAGTITAAQRDAALEALASDQPFDWTTLGVIGANIALALIGGPAIVRLQRGRPTQKVGLPASKVLS
jgi:hypothetical protein